MSKTREFANVARIVILEERWRVYIHIHRNNGIVEELVIECTDETNSPTVLTEEEWQEWIRYN